jgi:hypothetical protein
MNEIIQAALRANITTEETLEGQWGHVKHFSIEARGLFLKMVLARMKVPESIWKGSFTEAESRQLCSPEKGSIMAEILGGTRLDI